jgi:TonB-linked SusC/RagA family outer membrane protein
MNMNQKVKQWALATALAIMCVCGYAQTGSGYVQAGRTVTGTVTDEIGEPMPGVNVTVKGTMTGTVSDVNGKFSINVPNRDAVLVFSSLGYAMQEIPVGDQTSLNITLNEDTRQIEEVVVVGYGTQRKVNMTGAVSSVDMSKMVDNRPVTSLSAGLSGMAAGVFVTQSGGSRPGNDGATIRVRGQGTLNNSDPLVVIDGIPGNMNDVNPQDVESISILKDASSSAIYGSRAANGVVLITTRKGKSGTAKINYNGYLSWEKIGNKMKIVSNYADYMELMNEGYRNSGVAPKFSQGKIDEWRNAGDSDPIKYPNTDWQDEVFRTSLMQNHTLSATGGTDRIRYFVSGNYMYNPGIVENTKYARYSARTNIDADVKPWFTVGVNAYGYVSKNDINTDDTVGDGIFVYGPVTTPGMVFRTPDGRYGGMNNPEDDPQSAGNNPLYRLNTKKGDINANKIVSRFYGIVKPVAGLSAEGSYTYDYTDTYRYSQPVYIDRWNFYENSVTSSIGRTSVTNKQEKWFRNQMDVIARYELNVGRLNVQAMAGASQEAYKYQWFQAGKSDLTAPELTVLDAATADATASGNQTNWAMRSFFGRLNLNWDQKYLLEANFRRDGSSRFSSGSNRWGNFPSFSAGWRLSEEEFMKNTGWLNSLKLRASWGALGNNSLGSNRDNDGNYMYQSLYNASNYVLNNAVQIGMAQTALANSALTWETTYVTNFGFDFSILRNKFSGSIDYFIKNTEGILIDLPAPMVHGTASVPRQNAAKVRNRGVELTLNWTDRIGEVGYFVGGNFSYIKNKVTKFKGTESSISGTNMIVEGEPINIQYVMSVDRIVQTDEDLAIVQAMIDRDPAAFNSYRRPELGDFLYRDTDGDGKITDDDRIKVGNGTNPTVAYGVTFGASWKGVDFSCLLQGVAGLKVHWAGNDFRPTVRYGYQINREVADGRWYDGRTDAAYPRLLEYTDTRNTVNSDFWIQNKSYMRVKNIQLGYTFPRSLSQKILLETLRIYGSIDNALTFTKYKGLDPEVSGTNYPTMRQVSVGLNLIF